MSDRVFLPILARVRRWREHRRLMRRWWSLRPEDQLAVMIQTIDAVPDLRRAFRKALRVRGVPEDRL
jgi:hypothetical protein